MVYVLDENDRDCLTIRIDWSKGRYSPIPKATCEMLNRGCGCNQKSSEQDNDAVIDLTCNELKKLLVLGESTTSKEKEEVKPVETTCLTKAEFDKLLEDYGWYNKYSVQDQELGLGYVSTDLSGNNARYIYSTKEAEDKYKIALKERLEDFKPFKGKYIFDIETEKTDGVTALGYTEFGRQIYQTYVSCKSVDGKYCFQRGYWYTPYSHSDFIDGGLVPVIENDKYDNDGLLDSIQNRLYDKPEFGVVVHNKGLVVSIEGVSEENKQSYYTKLNNMLFNDGYGSLKAGKSTVTYILGEPSVHIGDAFKEQGYTVPLTISATNSLGSGEIKLDVPMETREVAE